MMEFTMFLGPFPITWTSRIVKVSDSGFTDVQERGPFQSWTHRHHFVPLAERCTEVIDEIQAVLQTNIWWKMIGVGIWLGMPLLFAYRSWKTRREFRAKA